MSDRRKSPSTQGLSVLDKASTPSAVGIGDGGSLNNTRSGVLIPDKRGVTEAGAPLFVSGEAGGVDVDDGGGRASPSLDTYVSRSNGALDPVNGALEPVKGEWSRQQKRGYHRIQSVLQYWQANGFQVLWVMLSTAVGGDKSKLAYHHQILRQRIERKLGYAGLQHFQVRTSEGNGVLHVFWAWRAQDGFRSKAMWVGQAWLSGQWLAIHGAPVVWVCRVKRGSVKRVSRYAISHYVGGQAGYEYMSWSWGRTFGFPLVSCWNAYKRLWERVNGGRKRLGARHKWWSRFLGGAYLAPYSINMEVVRDGYREWGKELWDFW